MDNKKLKRCLDNILSAMVKEQDAPMSAEMHLAETVVLLKEELGNVSYDSDLDLKEQLEYCQKIMALTVNR